MSSFSASPPSVSARSSGRTCNAPYIYSFRLALVLCLFLQVAAPISRTVLAQQAPNNSKESAPELDDHAVGLAQGNGWKIRTQVSPTSPSLSDKIRVDFDVSNIDSLQTDAPELIDRSEMFDVLQTLPPSANPGDSTVRYSFTLATREEGEHILPVLVIPLLQEGDSNHAVGVAESQKIILNVSSVVPDTEVNLKEFAPMASLDESSSFWSGQLIWTSAVAVMFLTVLILCAVWLKTRHRSDETALPALSPEQQFEQLIARRLPEHGNIKEHYQELSLVLRGVAERETLVPALGLTTEELLAQIDSSTEVSKDTLSEVGELLKLCDLVKYADKKVELQVVHSSNEQVRRLLDPLRWNRPGERTQERGNLS